MDEAVFHALMNKVNGGDETAAGCLFMACHGFLRDQVHARMDYVFNKGRVDPEDIIQEAYAAAWPKMPEAAFDNFAAFVGWMKKITQNKLIDTRRALLANRQNVRLRRSHAPAPGSSYHDLFDRLTASQSTPSKGVARQEALSALSSQIWRLPEDYRLVIRWRFIQSLPVDEIAGRLNRSEAAVHMLCHRALKKLKELMLQSQQTV